MKLDDIPNEPVLQIFKYLQYDDLCRMKLVGRHWYDISQYDDLWKVQCKIYWILDKKDDRKSWQETFMEYFVNFGRYIQVYSKIICAWNKLESHLQKHAPAILDSLQGGISEQHLNALLCEYDIDSAELPNSLRLFYRMHGGQNSQSSREPGPKYYTLPLSTCIIQGAEISIVLPGEQGPSCDEVPPPYSIVELASARYTPEHRQLLVATSFEDWFVTYADEVVAGVYPIDNGHILRYRMNPDFVARTGNITVRVCLPPADPNYIGAYISFQYRITMSMDQDAPLRDSCQLKDRHWYIISFIDSLLDEVHGRGVVGASYTWISSTQFKYPGGTMDGHFTMNYINDPSKKLEVKCPKFVMNVPRQYGNGFNPWRDMKWPNK